MKISVLMAVYDRQDTLGDAISSIAPQLSEGDEFLISDDGSSDDSLKIASGFAEEYPFIRILHHERTTIDDHMRYLIRKASGDIIIIADSDDVSLPQRVETIKRAYEDNNEVSCVYHDAEVIDETGAVTAPDFFRSFRQYDSLAHMLFKSTFFGACMSFRTEFGKKVVDLSTGVDLAWDKCIGFAAKKNRCLLFLDDILLQYRRWKGNVSVKERPFLEKVKEKFVTLRYYLKAEIREGKR